MDDLRRIDRGAAWTLIGNLLNILPALLELVLLRKFGLELWGEFLAAQAVVLVAGRVACLGLDKSMLWYLPSLQQQARGIRRPALGGAALAWVLGALMAIVMAFPLLGHVLPHSSQSGLERWVILSIPFFSASEILIGALMGLQRFHYRPLLRDLGASAFMAPLALALSFVPGIGASSLGIGFLAGHMAITALALIFWWKESRGSHHGPLVPTKALWRYATPIWVADSVNSAGQRASLLLLARLATPTVVGAFGVLNMIWQSATLARKAFETPLVAATASQSAPSEVAKLYERVVRRVLLWQAPIVILAACAGGTLLHLISPKMGSTDEHLGLTWLIACSFVSSGPAMGQQVLAGLGKSVRILTNSVLGTLVAILLLWVLVPPYGLLGTCLAQGLAVLFASALGAWQARRFANIPAFPGDYRKIALLTLLPSCAGVWLWIHPLEEPLPWAAWALGAFALVIWALVARPNKEPQT